MRAATISAIMYVSSCCIRHYMSYEVRVHSVHSYQIPKNKLRRTCINLAPGTYRYAQRTLLGPQAAASSGSLTTEDNSSTGYIAVYQVEGSPQTLHKQGGSRELVVVLCSLSGVLGDRWYYYDAPRL